MVAVNEPVAAEATGLWMCSQVELCLRSTDPSLPETGRCKIVREMFKHAAGELATPEKLPEKENFFSQLSGKEVKVGTIDCMKNIALCRRFRIHGYPSIAFFDVVESWPLSLVSTYAHAYVI